jgi:hypothetical protein
MRYNKNGIDKRTSCLGEAGLVHVLKKGLKQLEGQLDSRVRVSLSKIKTRSFLDLLGRSRRSASFAVRAGSRGIAKHKDEERNTCTARLRLFVSFSHLSASETQQPNRNCTAAHTSEGFRLA